MRCQPDHFRKAMRLHPQPHPPVFWRGRGQSQLRHNIAFVIAFMPVHEAPHHVPRNGMQISKLRQSCRPKEKNVCLVSSQRLSYGLNSLFIATGGKRHGLSRSVNNLAVFRLNYGLQPTRPPTYARHRCNIRTAATASGMPLQI